ncbi:MAG: GPW/gp25 family protein [Candidatus Limnocylindrales bacterium]
MSNLAFPLQFDAAGRTATATDSDHVAQMIEQLLFTSPGERVNRPDFGSGLLQLVFAPNSPEVASALQFAVKASLQRWLGDLIDLKSLDVSSDDSTLRVVVQYVLRQTNAPQTLDITRKVSTP